jgi:DNA replication protein DnaC
METTVAICSICDGSGWKSIDVEQNGKLTQKVTRCDCILRARGEKLLTQARIPKRYEHCELSNFKFDGKESLKKSYRAAMKYVAEFPLTDREGLLFIGSVGLGKTHLAVGIAKALILQKGISCLFYDYRELLKEIQHSYNASVRTTELDVLEPVFSTEVLILDELGAQRVTDWVWDTVSHIINTRYNNKKKTIFTTNFPDLPERAEAERTLGRPLTDEERVTRKDTLGDRIGERMRSRLHEMCSKIEIVGEDYRSNYKSASFR